MTYHASAGTVCFGEALAALKKSRLVRRRGWKPDLHLMMAGGAIQQSDTVKFSPWSPSQADVLAEDWEDAVLPWRP